MGTLTFQRLGENAWTMLHDPLATRWTAAEVLRWGADAQREVLVHLPSAFTRSAKPVLQAGTRQTLTGLGLADGLQPLSVICNYNAAGTAPGKAITTKSKDYFDTYLPEWHTEPPDQIEHVMFDPRDPTAFYVYPQADGVQRVELTYSAVPPEPTAIGQVIALADIYANAMAHYVLFRARSKDATYSRQPGKALQEYQLFLQSLGVKDAKVRMQDMNLLQLRDGGGVSGTGGG